MSEDAIREKAGVEGVGETLGDRKQTEPGHVSGAGHTKLETG